MSMATRLAPQPSLAVLANGAIAQARAFSRLPLTRAENY
jgi:hypothetical protein